MIGARRETLLWQVPCTVAVLVLAAACSATSRPTETPTSPSVAVSRATLPAGPPRSAASAGETERAAAYQAVRKELTDFLALWQSKGYAVASRAYLVPDQQPATSSDASPVLASGKVATLRAGEWTSAQRFVVDVDLDLTFSGDPVTWGNGVNTRFVTATARTGSIPYVLELATGP